MARSKSGKKTRDGKYTLEWFKGNGNKKYKVVIYEKKDGEMKKVKTVSFGDNRYEQYKDSTPLKLYTKKNHGDKARRKNYLSRSGGIKNSKGEKTGLKKFTANYFSRKYLW